MHYFLGETSKRSESQVVTPSIVICFLVCHTLTNVTWEEKQACLTADGHVVFLFTDQWPMTALSVSVCVCGWAQYAHLQYSHLPGGVPLWSGDHAVIRSFSLLYIEQKCWLYSTSH